MPKMQTSFSGLVTLLAKNLYTSPEVFIRELIQNAHDGCQRLAAVEPLIQCRLDVSTSPEERSIAFADNGIGMDESDIHEYLSTIGRSGTATEAARMQSAGLAPETIGQFGVGLLSAFVVAERIDVFTRKLGSPTGYHWLSHGGDDYTLAPTDEAPDRGTEITLTLKPEFSHFLRDGELARAIRQFADFLSTPIHLNGSGPINVQVAPWDDSPAIWGEEAEQEYREFIQRRHNEHPLLVIPVDLSQPRARGVLYVTSHPLPVRGATGSLDIYVRRMCIKLNDPELLPDWATFVRGIVDADAMPTAARDNLQRDAAFHALRRHLGELVIRALLDLKRKDPEQFVRLCNWHEAGIKGTSLRDDAFFHAVADHLPFLTNEGTLSLADYLARQAPGPSGRRPVYYFAFEGDETQFFQLCSANRILALNAGRAFDELVLKKYAALKPQLVELRRLDHLSSQQIYRETDPETAAAFQPALEALKDTLADLGCQAVVPGLRSFAPDALASVLIDPPGTEVLDRMNALLNSPFLGSGFQALAAEMAGQTRSRPMQLLLNARNPLVQSLGRMKDFTAPRAREQLAGLYHLATLNSQRRVRSECARQIDQYLQERLTELQRLDQTLDQTRAECSALRRCVEAPADAEAGDWSVAMKNLIGCTPAEFKKRVASATDAGVGELLLGLYRQLKSA